MNQLLKKKENQLKAKKGFTLVELIIVIAIIAILAVVAIPKFSEIRENANIKADIATAKSIQSAVTVAVTNAEEGFELAADSSTPNVINEATLETIVNGGVVPKAKAKEEKGSAFSAKIDDKGNVSVFAGETQVLPTPGAPYDK